MPDQPVVLGIDVGSAAVSAAAVNRRNQTIASSYILHQGDIKTALEKALRGFDLAGICGVVATSSTPSSIKALKRYDNRVALIEAARFFPGRIGAILIVGGERFGVIHFDARGHYSRFKSNTSCAAGTGGFLDQQARRLKLESIEEFSALAARNKGKVPRIASRCAVFAKTDLVHAPAGGLPAGRNMRRTLSWFGQKHIRYPVYGPQTGRPDSVHRRGGQKQGRGQAPGKFAGPETDHRRPFGLAGRRSGSGPAP